MDQGDILARLRGVIGATFEIDPASVTEATTAAEVPGWNSLSHLILLTGIEKEFDVELPMAQAYAAQNIGEMVRLIGSLTGADA
jgi:acyl carrier protein